MDARLQGIVSVCAAILLCLSFGAAAEPLDDARARIQEANAARDAMLAAVASQDAEAASQHRAEMRRLAREAQALYRTAGADRAGDTELLTEYAAALEVSEDFDLAVAVLQQAAAGSPEDAALWLTLGQKTMLLGDSRLVDARDAFEECVLLKPEDAILGAAYSGLAEVYRKFGFYDMAIIYLERTLPLKQDSVPNIIALAALYAREGRVAVAANAIEQLGAAIVPHVALLQEHVTFALADFERNRVWFADTADNHLAYAKLLLHIERFADSTLALERSVELDDQNAVAWNILGSVSRQVGNLPRAREAFERSLAIDPDQARTRQALDALNASQ